MLYLWPYIVFFSLPLLYPYFLNLLIPHVLLPLPLQLKPMKQHFPRMVITFSLLAIMFAIIHYNTLVHPFTLADNRHYTFYVFRILFRHFSIRYLACPIYFLCAWAVLIALGGDPNSISKHKVLSARKRMKQPEYRSPDAKRSSPSSSSNDNPAQTGPRTSFLLLWLLATAASVITAPLVEPRYFIVPWLIWRIHVAAASTSSDPVHEDEFRSQGYDHRLWLETLWFLGINVVVGYVFLYRGFEWVQEPGMVQRFMW